MRLLTQRLALLLAVTLGMTFMPAAASAQKALVYCPVTVDATGCNAIVAALTGPAYPLGVDRGYDGTGGTVDLKTVDLFAYSVFVVPSLADNATQQPYARLRDPEVMEHLKAALIGRIAMWSGSPDQGATNRGMKDVLIQNLAGWAGGAFGAARGPGLVALLDASANAGSRYDWVRAITPVPVTSDPALLIYNGVRGLNTRATAILTSGLGPIVYDNMATFGFQVPNGAAGVSLDAVGQTGTAQGGQVVLLTMEGGNSTGALVKTDTDDYAPGTTVVMTGAGWQPGETVKLTLHMDPLRDSDTELTAIADGNGAFTNTQFAPAEYDIGVRFVLTAIGQGSGRRAQTTFTDSRTITSVTLNGGAAVTVSPNEGITAVINVTTANGGGNQDWQGTGWRISTTAPGTIACINHANHLGSGTYVETATIVAPTTPGTYNAYFIAYNNDVCSNQPSNTFTLANAVVVLANQTIATISPDTKAYGDAGFTLTVTGTNFTATSVVRFNGLDRTTTYVSATQLTASIPASDLLTVGTFPITVRNGAAVNSNAVNLTVTPKTITGTFTAANKAYDGNTTATILTRTLTGVIGSDVVNLTGGTATFANKTAATGKTVTGSGFSLTGAQAGNYTLASTTLTTTADITPVTLTGAFTAQNKVYDGTNAATIATRSLTGVISPDVVSLTGGTATFPDKNVGTGKTVSGTGFTLTGVDAGNYLLGSSSLTTTANITAKPITVTAVTDTKLYDRTTTSSGTPTITPALAIGDTPGFTQAFDTRNAGTNKTLTPAGLVNDGNTGSNYTVTFAPVTTGTITAKALVATVTASNKVYDGNNTAVAAGQPLTGVIAPDVVTLTTGTTTFDNKNVGNGKTVTAALSLTGADAANYTVNASATATANITAKTLAGTITASNKVYDATTTAVATGQPLPGVIIPDNVSLVVGAANFDNANVGTGKTVTAALSLSGADAGNYTVNASSTALADITARPLTVSATATNKVYDGNANATVTLTDNRVSGDAFTTTFTTALFSDRNVGTAKTVTVSGLAITGGASGNYALTSTTATATANITTLTIAGSITAANKVYDGNTTATITDRQLTGFVSGDNVSLTGGTATFDTKHVGAAKTVTATGLTLAGTDAGNYVLASTTVTCTADITPRALTVSATGVNKVYDATTVATVTLTDNRVSGDAVTDTYSSASFADKNVGTAKPVSVSGISISGADAGNYTFNTTASTTADITPRALIVSATGVNKVYDGTDAATVTLSDNRVLGDVVTTAYTTATFNNKNVGTGKTVSVSGISLTGTDATNYTFNATASTTANITARALAVTATGINKIYDGTSAATVTLGDDRVSGDVFTANYSSAAFADKNVGTAKPVSVNGISLSGTDANNYTPNATTSTTADITQRALLITATGVNKVYDATTTATVTLTDDRVAGDVLTRTYTTATFADKNVGTAKPISVAGIAISGTDAPNYSFNTTATAAANITVATVTGSFTANDKVYDGNDAATIATRLVAGTIGGDNLTLTAGTATFSNKNVGTGKTVTGTAFTLGGTDAGNYVLASTTLTTTATITARTLVVSATGIDRVYDATTVATVTLSDDRVAGDVFTTAYGAAAFADKNVGTAKPVSVTTISITGTDAANYAANTSATTTATITVATVSGTITADNKIYDGATAATIATRTLSGVLLTDVVTLTSGSATFADKSVGTGKTVTASGFALAGGDATNYVLSPTTITTTANITQKSVTGTFTADNKVYDGTTDATIATRALAGTIGGDNITLNGGTATFADKNVGTAKTVSGVGFTLGGTDAPNYSLASSSLTTTADITPRAVTITADPQTKVYGTADPAFTYQVTPGAVVAGDLFTGTLTRAPGETVLGGPYAITQNTLTLGANYAITYVGANLTITPATVAGKFTASNKIYDATTAAAIATRELTSGIVGSDNVALTGGTATFSDKNAGTGKTVTGTGFTLGGSTATNYVLASTTLTTTADITPKALLVSAAGVSRVYDATIVATVNLSDDRVAGDVLTTAYSAAAFNNKNVGVAKPVSVTGITISGDDAGNYTANALASTTADITVFTVTGSFTADNKIYDGNATATIASRNVAVVFAGDVVSLDGGSATFDNKTVANGKAVTGTGFTLIGVDAPNYVLASTTLSTTANITPRVLTVTATGINKIYDGLTTANVTLADNRVSGDVFADTYASAEFGDKNVGTAKPVAVSGIAISGTDAGNYTFNATAATTADITQRVLTVSATGINKVYDGTAAATVTLSDNRVAGDVVTTAYTTAAFSDKNAGIGKSVTVSGISLTGTDAGNYSFNTATTTTADITKRGLVITASGINKIYDGATTATVTLTDDRVSGDVLTDSYTAANFADKNVGTGKPVSVTGLSIGGTDAGNYTFNSTTSTTADITQRALLISATGVNRVYDATTNATVTLADDRVAGDVFTDTYTNASFADKNVGLAKPVTVSGISIAGGDAGNYTFNSTASTTASITVATLTGSFTANDKVYDGGTAAVIATRDVTGKLGTDVVSMVGGSATFDTKNVGSGKTVTGSGFTLSGADANNYVLSATTLTTTAAITPRALVVSATGVNKVYDGLTTATVTLADNRVPSDDITSSYGSAAFLDKNVGTGKTVNVSGISITGTDAGNYSVNTTASTTADIAPKALTVSATGIDKVYDGTTAATVSLGDDRVTGDVLTLAYTAASFNDKTVGTNKPVNVSGISVTNTDAGNYTFNTTAATTASITSRPLAITATGVPKVYDGNTSATVVLADNRVSGDAFTTSYTATFNNKNVGIGKPVSVTAISISGADAGNYTANTSTTTTADITARTLTVSASAQNKVYDGNTTAIVTLADDRVAGDVLTTSNTSADFSDKTVGTGKTVTVNGIAIGGADAGNYTFNTTAATTANITSRPLAVTATALNKVYDGNATASVSLADNRVSGDVFTTPYTSALFNDENVGVAKTVTVSGISLTGPDAANYTGNTTTTTTADITTRVLTVIATGIDKVYDGTTAATVTLADDRVAGDALTTAYGTATFDNKNVGTGKTVSVAAITLTGSDAGNYTFNTTATTTATVTARTLVVSATGVNKVYDGNATATVTLADDRVSGDVLTSSYSGASFSDKNVGAGKPVSVTGISISGMDAGNYAANTTASTTADITARALAVTSTAANKVYDGNTTAVATLADNRVAGDVFTAAYTSATFNNANVGTAKPVSVTGISITGTDASNYTFNATAATTADITPRPITVTAAPKTKVYGDADPALTYAVTGTLVNAGDLTGTLTRAAGISVGTYAILQGSVALTSNYTLTYVGANLTITPRALSVTADNKSKIAGAVNPALTGVIVGIQYGDNITATYATPAVTLSLPGTYPITPTLVDPTTTLGNYTITKVDGTLTVTANALPVLGAITGPVAPTALGTPVTISVPFTDADVPQSQPYTATIEWGDATTSTSTLTNAGTITGNRTYATAGVYIVKVTIKQNNFPTTHLDTKTYESYVVVYDASAGFVTGGGWIDSPIGACMLTTACQTAVGKANFGFNAKYKKGANVPDGNTEFQFQAGNINFKATNLEWLVINGPKAQYKGVGTINGTGNYNFIMTAVDSKVEGLKKNDRLRMKIWDVSTGNLVYDNQKGYLDSDDPNTALGGGSITVHK